MKRFGIFTNLSPQTPDTLYSERDWRADAACANHDPELWFPVGEGTTAQQQTDDAVAVCRGCPSRQQCLTWAYDTQQDVGIWGGMTEKERRRVHKRRASTGVPAKPRRTPAGILAERAVELPGGHMTWPGSSPVSFHGWDFTPAQLAWFVAYGVRPAGHLRATCGHSNCIAAEHRRETAARTVTPEGSVA